MMDAEIYAKPEGVSVTPDGITIQFDPMKGLARSFFLAIGVCPSCGGDLSETRIQNGRRLRHCYSCHFEFEEETP